MSLRLLTKTGAGKQAGSLDFQAFADATKSVRMSDCDVRTVSTDRGLGVPSWFV